VIWLHYAWSTLTDHKRCDGHRSKQRGIRPRVTKMRRPKASSSATYRQCNTCLIHHCIFSALQFTTPTRQARICTEGETDDFAGGNAEEERGAERSSTGGTQREERHTSGAGNSAQTVMLPAKSTRHV
jgi:hypothetical protein